MAERTLSNPTVEIDNDVVGIIPNSLSYKIGRGDINMRPQATGNNVENIRTENAETKKGMVKLSLYNTKTNTDLYEKWQDQIDGVSIRFHDGGFTKSFNRMSIITDPEVNLGADGNIELEFEGQPAS